MATPGKSAIVPILVGYDAKKVEKRPEWLEAAGVQEICSVSGCISAGLSDAAFHKWLHNGLCLYDDEATLESLLAEEEDEASYGIFAYKLLAMGFSPQGDTAINPQDLPDLAGPCPAARPLSARYEKLGYDCVQTEWEKSVAGFGCSPLSCNGMAQRIPVNRFCLIETIDAAIDVARQFGKEQPEPGVYYVMEVWRRRGCHGGP